MRSDGGKRVGDRRGCRDHRLQCCCAHRETSAAVFIVRIVVMMSSSDELYADEKYEEDE